MKESSGMPSLGVGQFVRALLVWLALNGGTSEGADYALMPRTEATRRLREVASQIPQEGETVRLPDTNDFATGITVANGDYILFAEVKADLVMERSVGTLGERFPEVLTVAQGGGAFLRFVRRGVLVSSTELKILGDRVAWADPGIGARLPRGGYVCYVGPAGVYLEGNRRETFARSRLIVFDLPLPDFDPEGGMVPSMELVLDEGKPMLKLLGKRVAFK